MSIVHAQTDLTDDEPLRPEFPQEPLISDDDDPTPVKKKGKRRSTTHLKLVPETLELREQVRDAAAEFSRGLDRARAFTRDELESTAGKC